ncbi:MAG TPA: helix-turn-helix domain-containing protein [Solirubrobacteraceae bacterium]|jgi:DNA-binding transcriptional ArsR family regulator
MHTTESIAHPPAEELELGAVLHALSDPVRLRIVAKLAHSEGDHTCGSFALPVTKSTCTHHFKVLREAGVIQQRAQGTTRLNRLRREDLEARFPGLLECVLKAADHVDLLGEPGATSLDGVVAAASAASTGASQTSAVA